MNDLGLFILRVVAGSYIMKYGVSKLRDVDGAYAKEFEGLGFHPVETFVTRSLVESISGALIVSVRSVQPDR